MAASTETPKKPAWKQAKSWDDYFKTDTDKNDIPTERNVRIENSTGYQLYAVNDYTITSGLTGFTSTDIRTISSFISDGTLNLQLADVAYNTQNPNSALSRQ